MKSLGQKAESLLELKKKGLFKQPLLVLSSIPPFEEFCHLLNEAGLKPGSRMGVRFSSAQQTMNLPRSIIIESFGEAYKFIQENSQPELAIIVQGFVTAKYSGTFMRNEGKYYLSFIDGVWEAETAKSCDNVIISEGSAEFSINTRPKQCLFEEGDKLVTRTVHNEPEEVVGAVKKFWKKMERHRWEDDTLYEFIVMPDDDFTIMEFKRIEKFENFSFCDEETELLSVTDLADLKHWDGEEDILLLAPMSREDSGEFFDILSKIKPHKKQVYIKYGICSHPAIILREQGFTTIPYTSQQKIITDNI